MNIPWKNTNKKRSLKSWKVKKKGGGGVSKNTPFKVSSETLDLKKTNQKIYIYITELRFGADIEESVGKKNKWLQIQSLFFQVSQCTHIYTQLLNSRPCYHGSMHTLPAKNK